MNIESTDLIQKRAAPYTAWPDGAGRYVVLDQRTKRVVAGAYRSPRRAMAEMYRLNEDYRTQQTGAVRGE